MRPTGNVLKCPNCGLINPVTAERCDCGYDFPSETIKTPYVKEPEERIEPSLRGFGGWLMLFWYGMTVATPLILLTANLAYYSNDTFAWVFWLVFSPFCIYAGVALRRLQPRALPLVKVYLMVCVVLGCLELVGYFAGLYKPAFFLETPSHTAGGVIGAIIWWFYFKKSKRVRAAFGRNF